MGRLLPAGLDREPTVDADPRVIGIEGEAADDLLAAMSSRTARRLLAALHEEPAAPSELADRVDTSLQNAQYHLQRLAEAGAVEVVDTVYSEKGREMQVYGPADRPLVVVAGAESETASLRTALATLLAGLSVVGVLSVVVQLLAPAPGRDAGGDQVTMMGTESAATPVAAAPSPDPLGAVVGLLTEPGALFFLGGAAVLLAGLAVWYARR